MCLIPLLAGLPFYASWHEHDARLWQERFASKARQQARDAVLVLRAGQCGVIFCLSGDDFGTLFAGAQAVVGQFPQAGQFGLQLPGFLL